MTLPAVRLPRRLTPVPRVALGVAAPNSGARAAVQALQGGGIDTGFAADLPTLRAIGRWSPDQARRGHDAG